MGAWLKFVNQFSVFAVLGLCSFLQMPAAEVAPAGLPSTDTVAPAVRFRDIRHYARVSPQAPLSVQATDDTGVSKIELWIDQVLVSTSDVVPNLPNATVSFSWSATTNGKHLLQAKAYDAAGNTQTATLVVIAGFPSQSNPLPTPVPNALYVAPGGSPTGSGSQATPWDLQTALNLPSSVTQGKTIYLRGGLYRGKFISNLVGATVRSYPGEWARIDGHYTTTISTPLGSAAPMTSSTVRFNGSVRFSPGNQTYIESELVQINVANPDGSYTVVRGWGGTPSVSHAAGAPARLYGTGLEIAGSNTTYRDFELFNSNPARSFVIASGQGGFLRDGDGINVIGAEVKLINLIVHDNLDGLFLSQGAANTQVYGCIIYNNGHVASDRPHGHGLYIQNDTGRKTISNVISFNNFGLGMKAYGASLGRANGIYFDSVISFNNGSPGYFPGNPTSFPNAVNRRFGTLEVGSDDWPSNDISITNSTLYHGPGTVVEIPGIWLGRNPAGGNTNLVVRNNYVVEPSDAVTLNYWSNVVLTGNTFYQHEGSFGKIIFFRSSNSNYDWNNNTYFAPSAVLTCPTQQKRAPFYALGASGSCGPGGALDFNEWRQATGFDTNSTFNPARPTGKQIIVRANAYEAGRAHIAVYNWDLSTTVNINLANAGLAPGQRFEVRNVQDYFGTPALTNQTYTAGMTINLPMSGLTVIPPIGLPYTPASTAPEFAAFVVLPLY